MDVSEETILLFVVLDHQEELMVITGGFHKTLQKLGVTIVFLHLFVKRLRKLFFRHSHALDESSEFRIDDRLEVLPNLRILKLRFIGLEIFEIALIKKLVLVLNELVEDLLCPVFLSHEPFIQLLVYFVYQSCSVHIYNYFI